MKKGLQEKSGAQRKGLNIFYYGKGKGKTTAVIGLAVRAAGAGMNVFILQFVKAKKPRKGQERQSGEWPISNEFNYFTAVGVDKSRPRVGAEVEPLGVGRIQSAQIGRGFVGILGDKKERAAHVKAAKQGMALARKLFKQARQGRYDLIILDELVSALELNLLSENEIVALIKSKPKSLHLAYTGHDPFKKIIAASDLVSEIKMIKHPYYKGILAQRGIDF